MKRTDDALSRLWDRHPKQRINRILFVTYRFNFVWFHNVVLPKLRDSGNIPEVHVLATRNDDDAEYGDFYSLAEWAKWGVRFRRHYVPSHAFLQHAKFILVDWASSTRGRRTGAVSLGYGSANLTPSGWLRNLETWHWTENQAELGACRQFLNHLSSRSPDVAKFFDGWQRRLPAGRNTAGWLFGAKNILRKRIFDSLSSGSSSQPITLRIVSPYWDLGSLSLIRELLDSASSQKLHQIELWIDGSRVHSRRSDYATALNLYDSLSASYQVNLKTIRERDRKAFYPIPLHAKLIEIERLGRASRVFGSANFTEHAWSKSRNLETVGVTKDVVPFPELLSASRPDIAVHNLTRSALVKLIALSSDDDQSPDSVPVHPWINWAVLDESSDRREVEVSYQPTREATEVLSVQIRAKFDPARTSDARIDTDTLEKIRKEYSKDENWRHTIQGPTLLRSEYMGPSLPIPEKMSVRLDFGHNIVVSAGVEISQPDFEAQRDERTGIPLLASLDGILSGRKPIVPPLPKVSVEESPVDSEDEEEELDAPAEVDSSLASIADYNRLPKIEQVIRIYQRAKTHDRQSLSRLQARAKVLAGQISNREEQLAAKALLRALGEDQGK